MNMQVIPVVKQDSGAEVPAASGFPARYARFGNFQVDLQRDELHKDGQRVKVQAQVYRALLLLLARGGEIVSREDVRKGLWPEVFLANLDANVNTTMNKLRQVLGDTPEKPRYIETMPRRGYSFIAAVEYSDASDARPAGVTPNAEREEVVVTTVPLSVNKGFSAALRIVSFLVAGILLGALLTFVWFFERARNHGGIEGGKAVVAPSSLNAVTDRP